MAPTPAEARELREIQRIYKAAFNSLGVKVVAEMLDLWQDIPANPQGASRAFEQFLDRAVKVTGLRRQHIRRITFPYYRLARALQVGETIQEISIAPDGKLDFGDGKPTTLNKLRDDFYQAVESLAPEAIPSKSRPISSGDSKVPVDVLKDLRDKLEELDQLLHTEAAVNSTGIADRMVKDQKKLDTSKPARTIDRIRGDLHSTAGNKVAAVMEKSALDGGRQDVHTIASVDPKVIGYVRVSETGTPCGWCAMLISRGVIFKNGKSRLKNLYISKRSAGDPEAGGKEYHPNCHCISEPVYGLEQFNNSDLYDLNRKYAKLWPEVTAGLDGKQALAAWRRYIRNNPEDPAQVA